LGFIGLKHRELTSVTFDEDFAKTSGVDTARLSVAMVMAVSAAVVLAIKISGAMLTSALVIIPAVTAIQIGRGFGNVIATACVVSAVSIIFGLSVSFAFNLPSGAAIVLLNILFFLASITLKRLRKAN
ncbi:MAG: metal ABC transporter permease, partial [Nitrospinae bacterium]|nr:metal ABC transporter permease [Nitrospinota bacterium]